MSLLCVVVITKNKDNTFFYRFLSRVVLKERRKKKNMAKREETKIYPSSLASLHSHATSFGFQQVKEEEKSKLVGNVFTNVASSYDIMNDVMSGGLHRLWKERLVGKLSPFAGMKHLDVAGGTGDVAFRIFDALNSVNRRPLHKASLEETQIYVCDINPNMLNVGKQRAAERGLRDNKSLLWVEGDAEALSFDDNSMDGYTIAFGIRNVTHIEKALAQAYRYDLYSFQVIPNLGELIAGDRESYQYLVESVRRFPPQERFASMIGEAGFEKVECENLVGGVVAIHSAIKL
uniref:2-methoxy-6-polyprenyl-1,4-benzoquinol methylase, mitochondrial n=1 Tax=Brassica oleracea TaxID=3712 RepID=A0A3P6CQJ1_BRAOL|nr:unnamed protein product [Brassica oleracea]